MMDCHAPGLSDSTTLSRMNTSTLSGKCPSAPLIEIRDSVFIRSSPANALSIIRVSVPGRFVTYATRTRAAFTSTTTLRVLSA